MEFEFYNFQGELLESGNFGSFEEADEYCKRYEFAYPWKVV